jgi:penicillin-binding protein 2
MRRRLGQKTGIDLPGESAGFIPSPAWKERVKKEPWYVGDTYNISIGQGDILVSPLQVGVWTAAIANGGRKITPHLIEKIVDPLTKETVTPFNQATSSLLASPSTVNIVRQGMRECVTYGSCKMLGSLPFTSAGKTGTAQWSHVKDTHAWFSAFAPFNNPQIVVVVLIEEGGEGSVVAEPVARDFLAWWGKKYLTP